MDCVKLQRYSKIAAWQARAQETGREERYRTCTRSAWSERGAQREGKGIKAPFSLSFVLASLCACTRTIYNEIIILFQCVLGLSSGIVMDF